jgi:serine/threonine-protein kinase ATR
MRARSNLLVVLAFGVLTFIGPSVQAGQPDAEKSHPLLRDFVGLNVHTVQFKPELYAPVCRIVRDYHPLEWDVGNDTSRPTTFPMAANRVDWGSMYGSWVKAGFTIDACIMFDGVAPDGWKDPAADARAYGQSFARAFGPSAAKPLVGSAEIGNEPSKYSVSQYRTLFENMARGFRAGDPKLKIATCAVMTGKPDQWSKPMEAVAGLEKLYDVVNLHSYAFKEKWPTWRRSYPEDPDITWLKDVRSVIAWRNEHTPGKQVWLTEFGYDSATHPPAKDGPWKDWRGMTDEQQAQYIVRSFLVLSALDLARANLYFFNDKDEAQLHGASGITRHFKPKPSYYAMSQLYRELGDYRFTRALVQTAGEVYCYEYDNPSKPGERAYVAWSPTAGGAARSCRLPLPKEIIPNLFRAERMAGAPGDPPAAAWQVVDSAIEIEIGPSPVYLFTRSRR